MNQKFWNSRCRKYDAFVKCRSLFVIFSIFLVGSIVHAESGGIIGDINFDEKIGLEEAIYALQISAGLKNTNRGLDNFKVYRADVVRGLERLRNKQEDLYSEYNQYTDDLSGILSPPTWPDISFEIVSVTDTYFKIKATSDKIAGYTWSVDSECVYRQNDEIFEPGMEIFEFYRNDVVNSLKIVAANQKAYLAEYNTYTNDVSHFELSGYPDINVTIVSATSSDFLVEAGHVKISGYAWTIDSQQQIRTVLKD